MFDDLQYSTYLKYLNFVDSIHYKLFEFRLKFLGYSVLDYSRFYYFEYDWKYLLYNSDYNNLSFVKNHIVVNRIGDVVYYEEKGDKNKTVFKFNLNKNITVSWLKLDLNNFDVDKFFSSLDEEELSYVSEKINRLGV